jgi:predicted metal-dependent phosphoesterase TrpH
MKTTFVLYLLGAIVALGAPITRARTEINIPDIPGYLTLKCDLHMHTVFSDGLVWPTVRVEEAWREGLDAIAITDHIEYLAHAKDVMTASNRNRSAEIARGPGSDLDIIVIRGSEITRTMPPGHLNAIFITNANALVVTEWRDAIKAAHDQGAFIFWNHPGWTNQLTEAGVRWFPEHTELLEGRMLHGIEVVNGRSYYPEAHAWALEKKITMISNTDIHTALNLDYHVHDGDYRPMTLVFAKDRTPEAIKEALQARRTAVYADGRVIGEKQFLKPIFDRSIQIKKPKFTIKDKQRVYVQIANRSDIHYSLESDGGVEAVTVAKGFALPAHKTVILEVRGKGTAAKGRQTVELPYKVANLLVGPNEPLRATIKLDVEFVK